MNEQHKKIDRILYVEDEMEAVEQFIDVMEKVTGEKRKECEKAQKYLERVNVVWINDIQIAEKYIQDEQEAHLFIIDIQLGKVNGGIEIVQKIRQHQIYDAAEVWILSNLYHYRKRVLEIYHADRFFSKLIKDWVNLEKALFSYTCEMDETEYINISMRDKIRITDIISVEIHGRNHVLYLKDNDHAVAKRLTYGRTQIFAIVEDHILKYRNTTLFKISRRAIINLNEIYGFIGDPMRREYYVILNQRGTNKDSFLKISNGKPLEYMKEMFGKESFQKGLRRLNLTDEASSTTVYDVVS